MAVPNIGGGVLRVDRLQVHHLPPLSFEVPAGECFAIAGPTGAGKTLLLRALADLDPADGYVVLDGVERGEMKPQDWRRQVRYVAADSAWWRDTGRAHFTDAPIEKIARLMRSVDLSDALLDQPVRQLSRGERQRLALARAIVGEPKVLLLDEPTASLDAATGAQIEELIKFQLLAGRCVVLVSHDPAQIQRLSHQKLILGAKRRDAATSRASP